MKLKQKQNLYLAILLLSVPAGLWLISLATKASIPVSAYLFLLLASSIGILSSFTTTRVKRIMRFVPIKSLIAAALTFQCLETLHQKFYAAVPISAADFYPLALIATYLFTYRFGKFLRESINLKIEP